MASRVVAHPVTRPTEKGEHCGHHQNTATPPRRPRPPGRGPHACTDGWITLGQLVVDSEAGEESEEYAPYPCRYCAERKPGRREYSQGRGILRGPGR